jgi:hypothetical protein
MATAFGMTDFRLLLKNPFTDPFDHSFPPKEQNAAAK